MRPPIRPQRRHRDATGAPSASAVGWLAADAVRSHIFRLCWSPICLGLAAQACRGRLFFRAIVGGEDHAAYGMILGGAGLTDKLAKVFP